MVEFVELDVDGTVVRIGLTVKHDREAITGAGQWTAVVRLPLWTTPRAAISIRGAARDRASAVRDAVAKATEVIDRFEHLRLRQGR